MDFTREDKDVIENQMRVMLQATDWYDIVHEECKKIIRDKGINNVSFEYLLEEVFNRTKDQVDPQIKQQALYQINKILLKQHEKQ